MHRFLNASLGLAVGLLFSLPSWAVTLGNGNDYGQTAGPSYEVANAGTGGTTLNSLVKLNSSGAAITATTSDTSGILGVAVNWNPTSALGGSGTTGNVVIQWSGVAPLTLDNSGVAGDYVIPSVSSGGEGHDTGSGTTCPSAGLIGKVVGTASAPVYWVAMGSFQCSGSSSAITSLTGDVVTTGSGAATATVVGGPSLFCTGADGALNSGFGTLTLTRDMCWSSVTFNSTDQIITNGFRIFVDGILTIGVAQTSAIEVQTFSNRTAQGSTVLSGSASTIPQCNAGGGGGTGTATVGGNGTKGSGYFLSYGGASPASAAGGAGANAAGSTAAANTPVTGYLQSPFPTPTLYNGAVAISPGTNGNGAPAGGGDGTHTGGNGGAGGGCGGGIFIAAKVIARGTNTNAGIIDARGGPGGAGGNAQTGGTNSGGGGGGTGGGGGHVYIMFESETGSAITSAIDVSSGAGGAGGTGLGSGSNGTGGTSGLPGGIEILNIGSDSYSNTAPATTGQNVGSGTTGGASVTVQGQL